MSLYVSWQLAMQSLVFGSHEGNWVYGYAGAFKTGLIEVFVVAAVPAVALLWVSWRPRQESFEWPLVFAWCMLALGFQAFLRSLSPFSLRDIFANDAANSFYSVALRLEADTMLRGFERLRLSWPLHAQSNLPGKLLVVRGLTHITSRPDELAWLVIGLSNLGGALLYWFTREFLNSRRAALVALVLYLFTPAKLFFFPLLNSLTPVVVIACACLLLQWLKTARPIYAALLGGAIYGLVLFGPGALVVGLFFGALIAHALWRGEIASPVLVRQIGAGVAAFAAVYLVMIAWFDFNLLSALRSVGADAAQFNVAAARPYGVWVRQNLVDFLFGVGVCQVALVPVALVDGLVSTNRPRSRWSEAIVLLCLMLAAMLAAVDLIGVNRGEVIRLWMFLACLFQIPSAYVCSRLDSRAAAAAVLATTVLQDLLGCWMIGFVVPG
jgi:hypothetical protein